MKYIKKYIAKRLIGVTNALFIVFLLIQLLPDKTYRIADHPRYTLIFIISLEVLFLTVSFLQKKDRERQILTDIIGVVYGFFIFWLLTTVKLSLVSEAKQAIFPPPGAVLEQFAVDIDRLIVNVKSSISLILRGYLLAVTLALPLGLFLGWNTRASAVAGYIAKFIGSISPIVYIPYAIVLLPTFRAASMFVIIVASFWPVFACTMSGVRNVEKRLIDSAKMLCVSKFTMLFRIVLPAALPQILIGCNQGLGISFILIVSAEMIGARSGLGYYVNIYANFGNFTNTLVGVISIGIVVTFITFLFNHLQRYLLRWKQ
jgi:NitT/TauT family transport system permease protein